MTMKKVLLLVFLSFILANCSSKKAVNEPIVQYRDDFKAVSDAAAEIKKRSIRLRTNLVFPDSESKEAREKPYVLEPDSGQLKVSLQTLDRVIKSFVTNPVFTAAGVINAQQAAAAKGDLNTIIDLSDKIKKCADKLNKANGKTT